MNIFSVMHNGKNNKKVIFLLSGWQNKLWMFWLFAKILERNGYYCITYAYDKRVLSPNTAQTTEYLTAITIDILKRIKMLKEKGNKDFSIFGTSLGTLLALMVANKSFDISKVVLNTTGADIAASIWTWDNVNTYFKISLLEQNYTLKKLQKAWSSITPLNNIDRLQNKKILVFLAKKDELIPYYIGLDLLQEFKTRQYHYKVIVNSHLKHVFTGAFNLFNMSSYLSFLKE